MNIYEYIYIYRESYIISIASAIYAEIGMLNLSTTVHWFIDADCSSMQSVTYSNLLIDWSWSWSWARISSNKLRNGEPNHFKKNCSGSYRKRCFQQPSECHKSGDYSMFWADLPASFRLTIAHTFSCCWHPSKAEPCWTNCSLTMQLSLCCSARDRLSSSLNHHPSSP